MLIDFNDNTPYEERLKVLFAYHKIPLDYKVDEEDMPVLILALNQDDIANIKVNDEGAIDISYYGEDWQKPKTQTEEYEQTTIRLN